MALSILCPTRERPGMARRLKDSIDADVLFYVDDDDPKLDQYEELNPIVGPYVGVGKAWNILAGYATGHYLMMGNDDLVFHQKPEFPVHHDEPWVFWYNDGGPEPDKCRFPVVTRAWYETLGYFTPECFAFLFHDTWIWDVAVKADRWVYVDKPIIEHFHPTFGKGPQDETFLRHRRGKNKDGSIFRDTEHIREEDANRIRGAWQTRCAGSRVLSGHGAHRTGL